MVAVLAICVLVPPATSKDVNSYALYGRISAEYHQSPYTHVPRDFAADPWFSRTSAYWSDTPSVYGPAFTAISSGILQISGTSVLTTRLAFQLLAGLSLLAAVVLTARRVGWDKAIIGLGLNPLLLTFGVNDAHCDVLIGLAVLAGVLAIEKRWYVSAGLALAAAGLIKISLLPALFGAFVWLWFKVSKAAAVKLGAAGVALVLIVLAITSGTKFLEPLHRAGLRHTRFSIWNPVHIVLTNIFGSNLPTHSTADTLVSLFAAIAVFGVGLFVLWRARRNTSVVIAVVSIIVGYQVLGAYTLSWYAAWSVPALVLLALTTNLTDVKPLIIAMGHGCWLAVAYLSGYAVIVVSVVLVVYLLTRLVKKQSAVTA